MSPAYVRAQLAWTDVELLAFRKRWRVGGGEVPILVLLVAFAARMTLQDVGGRRSHTLVSFPDSLCAATTGRSASAVFNLVALLLKKPVRPVWSCG